MKLKSVSTKYAHFTFKTQSVTTAEILVAKAMPKTLLTLRISRVKKDKKREISKETYDYLTNFEPRISMFHLLPKTNKQKRPPPGRPVISASGSPTERIIKGTNHFLLNLNEISKLPPNCILFT